MGNKLGRAPESQFTKSTGLYASCEWDDKTVSKLINKKKIAPRYPGREEGGQDLDECPICFLWYPGGLNRSKCCRQPICTECFLQFKKPSSHKVVQCPFCNATNYSVKYHGTLSKEEREALEQEEQKTIEARIRLRHTEMEQQAEREKQVAEERKKAAEQNPPAAAATASLPSNESEQPRAHASRRGRNGHGPESSRSHAPDGGRMRESYHEDVEELMVMEAIRLSLLESHLAGREGGATGREGHTGESGGTGTGEDGARENGARGGVNAGSASADPAAVRDPRDTSSLLRQIERVESELRGEDASGEGLMSELVSHNRIWFHSLMASLLDDVSVSSYTPLTSPQSHISALEPASTLSPALTHAVPSPARSPVRYPQHRLSESLALSPPAAAVGAGRPSPWLRAQQASEASECGWGDATRHGLVAGGGGGDAAGGEGLVGGDERGGASVESRRDMWEGRCQAQLAQSRNLSESKPGRGVGKDGEGEGALRLSILHSPPSSDCGSSPAADMPPALDTAPDVVGRRDASGEEDH